MGSCEQGRSDINDTAEQQQESMGIETAVDNCAESEAVSSGNKQIDKQTRAT